MAGLVSVFAAGAVWFVSISPSPNHAPPQRRAAGDLTIVALDRPAMIQIKDSTVRLSIMPACMIRIA
ncbi:MAG: hypothetical protein AB7I59_17425 [Geminicoccaceae bacterium]